MTPMEVCEGLGLYDLKNRKWHIQGTCALKGDGLYEGLDWLASTLKELKATGFSSVGNVVILIITRLSLEVLMYADELKIQAIYNFGELEL
ncbi:ADP-ribosylation factor B1B [Actinidia rufa]|uniref:ADP-ribosylation factor B1B n=1 Tax=Actinidia rufa TaxID=165716 RepID=A0A7J0EBU4_9ERIC|nr:ADP-ribosylation factor B1B [Actinidia rufa]